ncbi:MAG: oligoendopeptidase F, partial [Hyphomicrobiaceae bacterium]|nr:oligoendopeptidase F [Hyphomicrobiaceae bacterium]
MSKDRAVLGNLPEWDLTDLYTAPDAPEVARDIAAIGTMARRFEDKVKGTLAEVLAAADGGARLAAILADYEAMQDLLGKLYSYAGLLYAGDTTDPVRAKFYGDMHEKLTAVTAHLLFFPLELNRVDEAVVEAALQDAGAARYKPFLDDVRKEKPYQLDDRLEQLFHEKSVTGRSAWNRLFDETISALRFDVDGEELTIEPTLHLMQDSDETKRRAAAEALAGTFKENIRTFTLVTNVLAKDKEISDRWRGFEDVADARHLSNRVEREVVDALVDAVTAAYPRLSHRYYALKAKWFGKTALDHWDRNAPLPAVDMPLVPWAEARETVLSAYERFSPKMREIAERFFDRNWIDAPTRPGKSPGAFAHPTVPSAHPYVLLNYQGRPRDVMTLAHELGHGVHQVLAGRQGPLMAPTPLTLAETASVFGEMLTFRRVLDATENPRQRKALIAGKVED